MGNASPGGSPCPACPSPSLQELPGGRSSPGSAQLGCREEQRCLQHPARRWLRRLSEGVQDMCLRQCPQNMAP